MEFKLTKSNGYYAGFFTLVTILMVVLVIALFWAVEEFAPQFSESLSSGGSTGIAVVLIMFPAITTAQKFYSNEKKHMGRGRGWLLAFICWLLWDAIFGVVLWINLYLAGKGYGNSELDILREDVGLTVAVLAVFSLLILLSIRLMFWVSIRGQIKGEAKRAARAAAKAGR